VTRHEQRLWTRRTFCARAFIGAFAPLAAGALASSHARAVEPGGEVFVVGIEDFVFAPAQITIPVGATVKWVNHDDVPHTIVEKALGFKSAALDTNDSFNHRFDTPGEVDYFCSLHPHMTGSIVVVPKSS